MDEDTAEIQRRIAEAKGIQQRLTRLQARIRQQHDQLDDVIREVSEIGSRPVIQRTDPVSKFRPSRHGDSGR